MEFNGEIHKIPAYNGIHIPAGKKHRLSNQHHTDLLFTVTSTPSNHDDRIDL